MTGNKNKTGMYLLLFLLDHLVLKVHHFPERENSTQTQKQLETRLHYMSVTPRIKKYSIPKASTEFCLLTPLSENQILIILLLIF